MNNVKLDRERKYLNIELLSYSIVVGIVGFLLLILCVWGFFSKKENFVVFCTANLFAAVLSFLYSAYFFANYRRKKLREKEKQRELTANPHQG